MAGEIRKPVTQQGSQINRAKVSADKKKGSESKLPVKAPKDSFTSAGDAAKIPGYSQFFANKTNNAMGNAIRSHLAKADYTNSMQAAHGKPGEAKLDQDTKDQLAKHYEGRKGVSFNKETGEVTFTDMKGRQIGKGNIYG